jgi:hypothetical protein
MKKFLFLISAALVMNIIPMKGQDQQKLLYEKKIHTYTKMRTNGIIMTGVGGGLALAGAKLLSDVDWNSSYEDDSYYYEDDMDAGDVFKAFAGICCAGIGVGLVAGGVTLICVGSHKVNTYKDKLNNISIGVIYAPNKQGLSLTYRF